MAGNPDRNHGLANGVNNYPFNEARLGVAPSVLKQIECALERLNIGDRLYVSELGEVTPHKTPFIKGVNEILMTIERSSEDRFSVCSGIRPSNGTFCVRASEQADKIRTALHYSAVLKSGDSIVMANFPLLIPSRLKSPPSNAVEVMQNRLMQAEVGERVILGRIGDEIPEIVSRGHVSVFIHDKQQREDGSIELTVEVTPGIRARKMVAVQLSDDEYRGIIGPSYVLAGKRLLLPDIGIITLPQEEGSSENLIESISARVSRNKRPLETYMARPSPSLESQHAQELGPVGHRLLDRTLIGRAVGKVIFDGLQSIKRGDFEDALDRFRNSQVLGYLGYQFEKNRMFSLNEITESAIIKNIHRVAADSWFHVQKRLVNPSVGCLRIGIEPRTPDEHALIARWQKEIALIYGEEYTHAYQDWKGGHVSRHAALIDDLSNEADVAALFFDQGVSLSVDFIKNRYPERETALARIVGAQTSADVEAFGKALFRLPLGATLTIGRNPELKPGGESFPIVSSITRHGEGIGRAERQRERAVKTLHETEISVTKARDGSFLMQAEHPNTRAFYRDQEGDVQVLRGPVSLAPGSTIYLGDSFRFNLECITK